MELLLKKKLSKNNRKRNTNQFLTFSSKTFMVHPDHERFHVILNFNLSYELKLSG